MEPPPTFNWLRGISQKLAPRYVCQELFVEIYLLHFRPAFQTGKRNLHWVTDLQPFNVSRFGSQLGLISLKIIPGIFVIAKFIELAIDLLKKYG